MSTADGSLRDLLRLHAYGTLARFWLELGGKREMEEDEAVMLLQLQQSLIEEFERTLRPYFDESAMKAFADYVDKFRVRISFVSEKPRIHRRR